MTVMQQTGIPKPTADSQLLLYLAWGCPFCHRVLAALELTGMKRHVGITWVSNIKGASGWEISPGDDPLYNELTIKGIYQRLEPDVDHVPSVPMLVDMASRTLLSDSSAQMTRFFSQGMHGAYPVERDLCPSDLLEQIDNMNSWLHVNINRAVYQVGFATQQADYEGKVTKLFHSLGELEARLATRPYLLGNRLTESDLFLLATLVRFDSVYYPLFRCSVRRIADYTALSDYLVRLQSVDQIAETFDHELIREHYFCSSMHVNGEVRNLNPSRLIPMDLYVYYQATIEESGETS